MAKESYSAILRTPLGNVGVSLLDNKLHRIDFLSDTTLLKIPEDSLSKKISEALTAYFNAPSYKFNLSFALTGTSFQQTVWKALLDIPAGKTVTYGELAKRLKTSPRAIGQACRTNPIPIIIPCHRVVAINDTGGYSGQREGRMLNIKKWLLAHESLQASH